MGDGTMTVYNGGAAALSDEPENDGCGGYRSRMKPSTDSLANIIIVLRQPLAVAAHTWVKSSPAGQGYDATLKAMSALFYAVDNWSARATNTQGTCSTAAMVALGMLGIIDCDARERRANMLTNKLSGVIGRVIRYIIEFFGSDQFTGWVGQGLTSATLMTTVQDYISRLLLNILCTFYSAGTVTTVATWQVIKVILTTTTNYVFEASSMGLRSIGNIVVSLGGGLVQYFCGLSGTLYNDVDEAGDALLDTSDEFIANNGLDEILQANINLQDVEDTIDEGAAIDAYEGSEEANELSIQANEAAKFMEQYVTWSLEQTEEGGAIFDDYQEIKRSLLVVSGRYDENEAVQNQVASQPLIYPSDDDEMDDEMDYELHRANTFGGVIQKKDIPFIKNLKKSAQRMKNKYKLGKKHKKRTQKHKKRKGRNMRARSRKTGYKYFNRNNRNNRKTRGRKNKPNKTNRR